ncbi:hypothetical protein FQN55_004876 [Onygenales sp. PD_40]|nr:hypothetical protein FQN55_004876 [Onygenales sp. PD_40]KAK2778061.1 hypothetical protein FQN53_001939 [Emmonsiellopsis sp. PD_33]KAK2805935.1 hypothetical protein FQN51_008709 [Onygenales sp. PD_10]
MGQKHNRRRTRPRSRNRLNRSSGQNTSLGYLDWGSQSYIDTTSLKQPPSVPPLYISQGSQPSPLAQQWHNRYTAWQNRERRQIQEAAKLEAEQFRLFGGEPGDDVGLCYRMLEYFGGLDYIDS